MKVTKTARMLLITAAALLLIVEGLRMKVGRKKGGRRVRVGPRRHKTTPSPPAPSARPLTACPPIPHVSNGQGIDSGNTIQYACQPGFVLQGTNTIICVNGRWTVAPSCRRQICPKPHNVPFAQPPIVSFSGTSATYLCLPGYRVAGRNGATSVTITCNIGTQSWPLPTCEELPPTGCGAPPTVANSQSTLDSTGTQASYTCITGYTLRVGTPPTIRCTNGAWSTTSIPVCDRNAEVTPPPMTRCLKAPPCGDEKIVREDVSDAYEIGGSVEYTCVTGYRVTGGNNNSDKTGRAFCLSDGTFSPTPTCEKVMCGTPDSGTQTITVVPSGTRFGDKFTYTCNTNYEASSEDLSVECMADGTWSKSPPTCTQKVCKGTQLDTIASTLGPVNYASRDIPIGDSFTFQCQVSYRTAPGTPGSNNRDIAVTCQADGTFTTPTVTCVYVNPESCADYFRRDNIFAATSVSACVTVTIDPQGPSVPGSTVANPGPATVQCCKSGLTDVCSRATATADRSPHTAQAVCTTASSAIFDSDTSSTESNFCENTLTTISYGLSDTELRAMIQAAGGSCQQRTTIQCNTLVDANFVLNRNGQTGMMYATQAIAAASVDVITTTNAFALCDCGLAGTCANGCTCVDNNIAQTGTDTVTTAITSANLNYLTNYQYVSHDGQNLIGTGFITITAGDIECCSSFTP